MKPYYDEDGITIYHGDCREILPSLTAYVVLTDPPYGIGADKNLRANKRPGRAAVASRDYGEGDWDDTPADTAIIERLIDSASWSVIWGANHFGIPRAASCWLVWDKDNGRNGYADCELAWTNLPLAVRRKRHRWMGMLQEQMGADKEHRYHPTQKPVRIMTWALGLIPEPYTTVLDPYMGSGTTLVAAKQLNRRSIGIELSERYCEIAAKRLAQGVLDFGAVS